MLILLAISLRAFVESIKVSSNQDGRNSFFGFYVIFLVVVKMRLFSFWLPHGDGFFSTVLFSAFSCLFFMGVFLVLNMLIFLADCSLNRTSKVIYFTMIILLFWELNEDSLMAFSVCHLSFMQ